MGSNETYFSQDVSEAIGISRVICIVFMMFVHVWPGASRIVAAETNPLLESFYAFMVDDLARASVPLLSIISGLLWWRSLMHGRPRVQIIKKKIVTLLLPMAAWSAALLLLHLVHSLLIGDHQFWDKSLGDWINQVFAIYDAPINLPLSFLRDIFLCGAMVTIMDAVFSKKRLFFLIALFFWIATESILNGALLFRPQIAIFFGMGVFIAVISPTTVILPSWTVLAALLLDLAHRNWFPSETWLVSMPALNGFLHRLAMAMVYWKISTELARHEGFFKAAIQSGEDRIFLVFCSHMLTISVMSAAFSAMGIRINEITYIFIFFIQVPIIFASAEIIRVIGNQAAPRTFALLTASLPGQRGSR